MSSMVTNSVRRSADHFEPEADMDPAAQRKLRGQLEKIDYTAFACNREVVAATLGKATTEQFQRLALAAAHARAQWVREALLQTETTHRPGPDAIARVAAARHAFDELTLAYETLRRMVERGYLPF